MKVEIENKFAFILDPSQLDFQPAHMIATFFDPKYVKGLKIDQRNFCMKIIIRDILSTLPRPTSRADISSTFVAPASSFMPSGEEYEGFFEDAEETTQIALNEYDQLKRLRAKLEVYVHLVLSCETDIVDPISFWAGKITTFGDIAKYALNILTVPASSAGTERVFSLASIVQGGQRYRLSAKSTEKELMIKVNRDFFGVRPMMKRPMIFGLTKTIDITFMLVSLLMEEKFHVILCIK